MKLNIKASSENGKVKSVSGNEEIDISLHVGNRIVGTIHFSVSSNRKDIYIVNWVGTEKKDITRLTSGNLPKGEKQKGEYGKCDECMGETLNGYATYIRNCTYCK